VWVRIRRLAIFWEWFCGCVCVCTRIIVDLLLGILHFVKLFCIVQLPDLMLWELLRLQGWIPSSEMMTASRIYLWFPRSRLTAANAARRYALIQIACENVLQRRVLLSWGYAAKCCHVSSMLSWQCTDRLNKLSVFEIVYVQYFVSLVVTFYGTLWRGWGTVLQAGRQRVRFLLGSLRFFIDSIVPAALWPWGRLNL
jgi:hypothetical protein